MKRLKKYVKFLPFIIVIVILAVWISTQFKGLEEKKQQVRRTSRIKFKNVIIEKIKKGSVVDYIWAQGRANPINSLTLRSEISRKITRIAVQLGQWVRKGDLMFCFDEKDAVSSVNDAKSLLHKAEANFDYANEDYENKEKLSRQGFNEITKDVMNRANQALKIAKASVEQAKAVLTRAENNLRKTIILAPFTGVITDLYYETENELININTPLAKLSDLSSLKLKTALTSEDIAYIRTGIKIDKIDLGHKKVKIIGEITGVAVQASEAGTFRIEAVIRNPGLIIPIFKDDDSNVNLSNISKTFELLELSPKLPPKNYIALSPDLILGSIVCRIRLPKAIIKNCFSVPIDAILRIDGVDNICMITKELKSITTFGAEDKIVLNISNFIPVKVYRIIDDIAVILSDELTENMYVAIQGQKTLRDNEPVIVKKSK